MKMGTIFLFHDTQQVILDVLPDMIEHCSKNGIEIIPLKEFINIDPYETT